MMKRKVIKAVLTTTALTLAIGISAMADQGWKQDENGLRYEKADGNYGIDEWVNIDGEWYFLGADGYRQSNTWIVSGKDGYYLGADGKMLKDTLTPDGLTVKADGSWDYLVPREGKGVRTPELNEVVDDTDFNWQDITITTSEGQTVVYSEKRIRDVLMGFGTSDELNEYEKTTYNRVRRFLQNNIEEYDDDYEKVIKITEFIWNRGKLKAGEFDKTSYGVLNKSIGSSEGYASAFKLMANAAGLECYYVKSSNYAWNKVKIDGDWYNIDVTESKNGYSEEDAPNVIFTDDEASRGFTISVQEKNKYTTITYPASRYNKPIGDYPQCTATDWSDVADKEVKDEA